MPLNLTEAEAVNRLIQHLTGQDSHPLRARRPSMLARAIPDRAEAVDALVDLAGAAYKRLSAGFRPDTARAALDAHWPGALREVWLLEMHGSEPEPFATEQTARHHALTEGGWHPDTDLAWRTGEPDEAGRAAKTLYADGRRTHCVTWPAPIRGLGAADTTAADSAPDESVARCKVCGCTEDDPCDGGCAWVTGSSLEIDLCTACAWPIARDAIASGLYQLAPTNGDSVFEARGGLIPQPMLTDQEIARLQPLMDAVEAANGDPDKLAELAREHGVPRLRLPEGLRAEDIDLTPEPGAFLQLRAVLNRPVTPMLSQEAIDGLIAAAEATNGFPDKLAEYERQHGAIRRAMNELVVAQAVASGGAEVLAEIADSDQAAPTGADGS